MADTQELQRVLAEVVEADRIERMAAERPRVVWRQGDWVAVIPYIGKEGGVEMCQTALCFAGWKAHLDGYTEVVKNQYDTVEGVRKPKTTEMLTVSQIAAYAQDELDLEVEQADILFGGDNDLDTLKTMVEALADGTFDQAYLDYDDEYEEEDSP